MFDDPDKALRRLHAELLAEEGEGEPHVEEEYDEELPLEELFRDFGEEELPSSLLQEDRELAELLGEVSNPLTMSRLLREEPAQYRDDPRQVPRKKTKKEKGTGGLTFLLLLELAGIAAIVLYWVKVLW